MLRWTVLLLVMLAILVSCAPSRQAAEQAGKDAPAEMKVLQDHVDAGLKSNDEAGSVVGGMTPENVQTEKPKAMAKIGETKTHLTGAQASAKKVIKFITVVVARNDYLEDNDPLIVWLKWAGRALIILSALCLILKLVPQTSAFMPVSMELVGAAFLLGGLFLVIAKWLPTIELAIALISAAGLVSLAVYFAVKAVRAHLAGKSIIASVRQAIDAGAVDLSKAVPIFNKVQSADAKRLVDNTTGTLKPVA